MSIEENKTVVGRWFAEFWGPDYNPAVIDELAPPTFALSTRCTPPAAAAIRCASSRQSSAPPSLTWPSGQPPS